MMIDIQIASKLVIALVGLWLGKDESWIIDELRKKGIDHPEDVLYAEWSDEHGLHVQMRNDPHVSLSSPVG